MADTTIKVKELPVNDMARVFNRVDTRAVVPSDIYDMYNIPEGDRAVFNITPANASVRDDFKQIMLGFTVLQNEICAGNGIPLSLLSEKPEEPAKSSRKKYAQYLDTVERVGLSLTQINQAISYEMTNEDARSKLAQCVTISNYKELDGSELVESKKSTAEILASMPSVLVEWLFTEVQDHSNLTNAEVFSLL